MNKIVRISQPFNEWLFVAQLCSIRSSDWLCERQSEWLEQSGGTLNEQERSLCDALGKLHKRHDSSFVEIIFLEHSDDELQRRLESEYGNNDASIILKAIRSFAPRFELFWATALPRLELIREYLVSHVSTIDNALADVERLCGLGLDVSLLRNTPLYLAIASSHPNDLVGWFSHSNSRNTFVLEFCDDVSVVSGFLEAVIVHEMFHIGLRQNDKLMSHIHSIGAQAHDEIPVVDDMKPERVYEEILVSSFTPEGAIAEKHFGKVMPLDKPKIDFSGGKLVLLRRRVAGYLSTIAREYIDSGKTIDDDYFAALLEGIKKAGRSVSAKSVIIKT